MVLRYLSSVLTAHVSSWDAAAELLQRGGCESPQEGQQPFLRLSLGGKFTQSILYVAHISLSTLAVLQQVLEVVKGSSTEALAQTQDISTCYTATLCLSFPPCSS